jgi:hypothetical protein
MQRALDLGTPDDTAEAASRFKAAGIIAGELTHYDAATADLNKSLALYQGAGDAVNVAYVYQNLATFDAGILCRRRATSSGNALGGG